MKLIPSGKIYISQSNIPKAGRGVFAYKDIKKGVIIETVPVFVLPRKDYSLVKQTDLRNYYFMWGKVTVGIGCGFASFYNHSYTPNAIYKKKIKEAILEFSAIKDIKKDEEITINYNYGNLDDKSKIWIKEIPQYE